MSMVGDNIELPIPMAEASSSALPVPPPWIELPEDVTANILKGLGVEEILASAQKVCTTWRRVCQDPAVWRVIDLKNRYGEDEKFDLMCRYAVDRSQGQLLDLSIACFGEDALLHYVADRSSHLRRLTLADCLISGTALTEAVKKLPELEELHLIMMSLFRDEDVKAIGISCPMLKSFTVNELCCEHPEFSEDELTGGEYNKHALAIGETMPNLRHLQLIALGIQNEGLEAVLDGCPHLESLDLRQCFGLDLDGALGKRCRDQIKALRLPFDSISDLEWPVKPSYDDRDDSLSSYSGISNFSDLSYGEDLDDCEFDYDDDYDNYDYDYDFGDDYF